MAPSRTPPAKVLEAWKQESAEVEPTVKKILNHILSDKVERQQLTQLESDGFLEDFLWSHYMKAKDGVVSTEHILCIMAMVNHKYVEGVDAWRWMNTPDCAEAFAAFFQRVLAIVKDDEKLSFRERNVYMIFLIHAFSSLEVPAVRSQVLRLVYLPVWAALSPARQKFELQEAPDKIRETWRLLETADRKRKKKGASEAQKEQQYQQRFLMRDLVERGLQAIASLTDTVKPEEETPEMSDAPPGLENSEAAAAESASQSAQDPSGAKTKAAPLSAKPPSRVDADRLVFCERFLELLIDILSQLSTRRFFSAVLEDLHILVRLELSPILGDGYKEREGHLLSQLTESLKYYLRFEINNHSGESMSHDDLVRQNAQAVETLQRKAFQAHPEELKELCLATIRKIQDAGTLSGFLRKLGEGDLRKFLEKLDILHGNAPVPTNQGSMREVYCKLLQDAYSERSNLAAAIQDTPVYPTEAVLWDENIIPREQAYYADQVLALPKLNLQFLTLEDYLLRNFHLFRLESSYEIRDDIENAVRRLRPVYDPSKQDTVFLGWSRMALPLSGFRIVKVAEPRIGEVKPASVVAEITYSLEMVHGEGRNEWDNLRELDAMFLLSIRAQKVRHAKDLRMDNKTPEEAKDLKFCDEYGVALVRGCALIAFLDDDGNRIEEGFERDLPKGHVRRMHVHLDSAQYHQDVVGEGGPGAEAYTTFNILLRRNPKENNFKSVLESIQELLQTDSPLPDWLKNVFLGYGNPCGAHYTSLGQQPVLDFNDTFLSWQHLVSCFPDTPVRFSCEDESQRLPPFRLRFVEGKADPAPAPADAAGKKKKAPAEPAKTVLKEIIAEPYVLENKGPYPEDKARKNPIEFTTAQVEAIRSSLNPGLTVIVGPPGTGKTDVAVQALSLLYKNFPEQRTLIVTHSNQALNDIFEKIIQRDVEDRHLLRLGHGEEALSTEKNFQKYGRVNDTLARRIELLGEVERLAKSMDVECDVGYSCETAGYFFLYHVARRWKHFNMAVEGVRAEKKEKETTVSSLFPFNEFFSNAPEPIFCGDFEKDLETARGCYRHLEGISEELENYRPFELLRSNRERANYLLTKQAKIIAMTCTHAAIKRGEFLLKGLKYDNLIMEESAQISEIETLIPMQLQGTETGIRLKRIILLGDHHQLPPIVQNMALAKYSHLDQSMFSRLVRLGVPHVELDMQGRARASLANLYSWRYTKLGDLPNVRTRAEFQTPNMGFECDYQLVDVQDYHGRGETQPSPFFYQNLGEAEYIVQTYMFMRLLGYPANKISIITTYNGQRALIEDVLRQRCERHPLFGWPDKVATVDKFQGQQNDYILLSLVRTRNFGHIRDVRRLVVAMSRARLGLYVFCRHSLFKRCKELAEVFTQLSKRPTKMQIYPEDRYQAPGTVLKHTGPRVDLENVFHLSQIVDHMQRSSMAQYWAKQQELVAAAEAEARKHAAVPPEENNAADNQPSAKPDEETKQSDVKMEEDEDGAVRKRAGEDSAQQTPAKKAKQER
eukprot:Rmarinus@m.28958